MIRTDNTVSILLDNNDNIKYIVNDDELELKLRNYHIVNDDYKLKTIIMELNRIFPLTDDDLDPHDTVYEHIIHVSDSGMYTYKGVNVKKTNKHFNNLVKVNELYSPSTFNVEDKYIIKIYRYLPENKDNKGEVILNKVMDSAIKEMTEYKLKHIDEIW